MATETLAKLVANLDNVIDFAMSDVEDRWQQWSTVMAKGHFVQKIRNVLKLSSRPLLFANISVNGGEVCVLPCWVGDSGAKKRLSSSRRSVAQSSYLPEGLPRLTQAILSWTSGTMT